MTSIGIVIPCHNHGRFLGDAIGSALSETRAPAEILVVDDGSTDETSDVANNYPHVGYVRQSRRGLAGARNRGLRDTSAEFLVFLDADDRLLPGALEAGADALRAHDNAGLVAGRSTLIGPDGSRLYTPLQEAIPENHYQRLLAGNVIWCPGSVMYRRTVLESLAGFDPDVDAAADYDMYLHVARTDGIYLHDRVVAEYRQHGGNMSGDSTLMLAAILRVLDRQEAYTADDPVSEAARRRGLESYRRFYSDPLIDEMRRHFATRARAVEESLAAAGVGAATAIGRIDAARELTRLHQWLTEVFALKMALIESRTAAQRASESEST